MEDYIKNPYNLRKDPPWEAFCGNIRSVVIGESVTSLGDFAFCGCLYLDSATVPASVISIGSRAFFGCSSLRNITFSASGAYEDYYFYDSYHIPSDIRLGYGLCVTRVPEHVTVGREAFSGTRIGTRIPPDFTLPHNQGDISFDERKIGEEAFSGVAAEYIALPAEVQEIGSRTFAGCGRLRYVYIDRLDCQIAEDAFEGCPNVTLYCASENEAWSWANAHGIHAEIGEP